MYGLEKHLGGIQPLFFVQWIDDLSKINCIEEYKRAKSFLVKEGGGYLFSKLVYCKGVSLRFRNKLRTQPETLAMFCANV